MSKENVFVSLVRLMVPLSLRNRIRIALKRYPFELRSRWPDLEMFSLSRGDVVFDVGANIGTFTESLLAYQPRSVIHAFEPAPEPFGILKEKFRKYPGVHCNSIGLGSRRCREALNISRYDQASSFLENGPVLQKRVYGIDFTTAKTIEVPVDTLAHYADARKINRIRLLKLDVQGYEIEVLKGAEPILSSIEYIYAEAQFQQLYSGGPMYTDLFEFLNSRGHQLVRMTAFRCDDEGKLMECDMIFKNLRLGP